MITYETSDEITREDFPDGSALITFEGGGMLILESGQAEVFLLRDRNVRYTEPRSKPDA